MRHGSLLNYLRRNEATLGANVGLLLDMCIQVKFIFKCQLLLIHLLQQLIPIIIITGLQRHGLSGKA